MRESRREEQAASRRDGSVKITSEASEARGDLEQGAGGAGVVEVIRPAGRKGGEVEESG